MLLIGSVGAQQRLARSVHRGGVALDHPDASFEVVRRGDTLGDLRHATHQPSACLLAECPDGPPKLDPLRHNIVRFTAGDPGYGDHGVVDRVDLTRHECLQRLHQCRCGDDRVTAEMRPGGMAAGADELDRELVGGRHRRSLAHRKTAGGSVGPVVQAEHRLHGKAFEKAVGNHGRRAALPLLGGLEQKHHGAVEIRVFGQMGRRTQQHGRVPVVAAGVHPPRVTGMMVEIVLFLDRQRIHIGTQADGTTAVASL